MRTVTAEANATRRTSPRWAAVGGLVVLGLVALDVGAVAAALPSMRVDLGSSTSGLVWVQDGYLLALAVGLVLLGPFGAAVDARLLAVAGVAVFAGGAALASAADSTATLVTGRVLQGAGTAALLGPAHASLRGAAAGRSRGVAAPGGAALFALALAPLVGGGIAEQADWRWLLRLEAAAAVPALLVAAAAGARRGTAPAGRGARGRGAAAPAAGLVCGVTGLVQSGPWGWASADTLLLLLAGAGLLLYAWQDGLSAAEAIALTLAGCLAAALLLAPQYLELVRGLSPLRTGVLTLAVTLPAAALGVAVSLVAGRLSRRVVVTGGLACATLGALGMTRIDPASSYALVVLSLALLGTGAGAAAAALPGAGDLGVSDLAATAAAGAALVVAASGALLLRAQLDERQSGGSFEDALAAGVAATGWLLAALLVAAAALAWRRA